MVRIGVFLLTIATIGCDRPSDEIDYRGEKIKLTKAYADFDDYKNDPENIHPSETERVQQMVLSAPIARTVGMPRRHEVTKGIPSTLSADCESMGRPALRADCRDRFEPRT